LNEYRRSKTLTGHPPTAARTRPPPPWCHLAKQKSDYGEFQKEMADFSLCFCSVVTLDDYPEQNSATDNEQDQWLA
jgi:hypothetical protein